MTMLFFFFTLLLLLLLAGMSRLLNSLWLRPRWMEKQLRKQGLKGNSYRFMVGDMKEMAAVQRDALSKPMDFDHRILPRANPFLSRTLQRYGKRCFVWVGTAARVVVWDPKMMTEILQNKVEEQSIRKPRTSNSLGRLLINGIIGLDGDAWANRRKAIAPAFNHEKLKSMVPAFATSCSKLIDRWQGLIPADGCCEIDVWPEFKSLAGDIISRTAFGSSFEEGKIIFQLQEEQAALVAEAARVSIYIPAYRFLPTRKNRRIMRIYREINAMLMAMVGKKLKAVERGDQHGQDLLGQLLQVSSSAGSGYSLTVDEIIDECKLFYFAGHETNAVWQTWTAVLLAKHQEWQQRAREEVVAVCGATAPTLESLSHLKTLTMILYEVLRLYPPALSLYRMAGKPVSFGGLRFPAGVQFVLPIAHMHHSAELWGDDAEEFNPERFSEGVAKASAKAQGGFFPFGWGPRICLGQSFAVMEAKMAMASLLQRFSFHLSPAYTHAPHTVFTLQPQLGAHLIIRKIQHQQ